MRVLGFHGEGGFSFCSDRDLLVCCGKGGFWGVGRDKTNTIGTQNRIGAMIYRECIHACFTLKCISVRLEPCWSIYCVTNPPSPNPYPWISLLILTSPFIFILSRIRVQEHILSCSPSWRKGRSQVHAEVLFVITKGCPSCDGE